MYVSVALARPLESTLTYEVPERLKDKIKPGIRVIVPLGRRMETGWIFEILEKTDLPINIIKPIRNVVDGEPLFDVKLLNFLRWISDYYLVSPGYVAKAAMPPGIGDTPEFVIVITDKGLLEAEKLEKKKKLSKGDLVLSTLCKNHKMNARDLDKILGGEGALRYCYALEKQGFLTINQEIKVREDYLLRRSGSILSDKYYENPEKWKEACKKAPVQMKIIEYLEERKEPLPDDKIMKNLDISSGPLAELNKKGLIKKVFLEQERETFYPDYDGPLQNLPDLTDEQMAASLEVLKCCENKSHRTFLIRGITGSGKTEVYLYLCHKIIAEGKKALILIPEISLTPQLFRRFQEHFAGRISLLHSGLSPGERFEQWLKAKRGLSDIVVGTRSAVFAPIDNLGLIVVDEEHDGSYKQDETPRYNARDLAIKRGEISAAPVLLGSATPAVESYYNALQGKYHLLELKKRFGDQELPKVTIVDMREEFKRTGIQQEISSLLDDKIKEKLEAGGQVLVLINRRGYRARLICRECGRIVLCKYCNVAMKYHHTIDKLVCHFCDSRKSVSDRCEYCRGELIEFAGIGTQRVEEILQRDFRTKIVMRMDQDTTGSRGAHYRILEMLRHGHIDILVGTQMIAKGHDYPRITLVGVISAESILALPDFRHSEKTFQLLTQVGGRAGRGENPGEVIIQTFAPDHYSIRFAEEHDYVGFYKEEILLRERLSYPPFSRMAVVRFEGKDKGKTYSDAYKFKQILDKFIKTGSIIRGPKSAPISKLRDRHRIQIIIRCPSRSELSTVLAHSISSAHKEGISKGGYIIDIDPYNLM
jgi:primosomal protein N' (replication factor Y)